MAAVIVRPATFPDAKAIDAILAGFPPLRRDLDGWVNQADLEIAAIVDNELVGFAAKTRQKLHPQRDLATVYVTPRADARDITDTLFQAVAGRTPLKMRFLAEDHDAIAAATTHGYTQRITSATYVVPARDLAGATNAVEVDYVPNEVFDAFDELYTQTHSWDPPQRLSRRFIRKQLLAGARRIVALRDDDARLIGVGAAYTSDDETVAADISLAGAIDQSRSDAPEITRAVVAALASFYVDDDRPLWFEADDGHGVNTSLTKLIQATGAVARDTVVVLTSD